MEDTEDDDGDGGCPQIAQMVTNVGVRGALLLLSIEGDRAHFVRTRTCEFFGKGLGVWGLGRLFLCHFKLFWCQVVRAGVLEAVGVGWGVGGEGGVWRVM